MGRKKKSEILQENTKNVGEAGQDTDVPAKSITKEIKKRKASESDMETIWPGLKRCLDCGFALALTTGETEYINEKGEKVIEKFGNETKLHNSYHGRWNDARKMYGAENVLTYKALRDNLEVMPIQLESIKENDYIEDILDIPNVLSRYSAYVESILKVLPMLQKYENTYCDYLYIKSTEIRDKKIADAETKRESEIKMFTDGLVESIKKEINTKYGAVKTPESEEELKDENIKAKLIVLMNNEENKEYINNINKTYDSQINAMNLAEMISSENIITDTCAKIIEFSSKIEILRKELDTLYKGYSLETVEQIAEKYSEILTYYSFIFSDINNLFSKTELKEEPPVIKDGIVVNIGKPLSNLDWVINKTLESFDFSQFGFDIHSVHSEITELSQRISIKRDKVRGVLTDFFKTEFTRSIRLWDFGKAQPEFEDFCVLLWNTPKFLKFIKPYMTEYQYLTYTNNNKANRRLIDYKFDDAPYYFGNVTESDVCYNCRKNSQTCAECDSLESVSKCYSCDFCKCQNCDVKDLSYVDDLIYMVEDDLEDDSDDTPITEEELLRNEKIMEGFSKIMNSTNVGAELTHPDIL